MPTEDRNQMRQELAQRITLHTELHQALEQPRNEHEDSIHQRLVKDRLKQRRAIVVAEKRHRVGNQHRLADNERRISGKHEAADGNRIVGKDQIRRQYDQIEADEKEDHRLQDLKQLAQQPGAEPAKNGGRSRLCRVTDCRSFLEDKPPLLEAISSLIKLLLPRS
jgi:hypothetical protein